MKLKIVAKLFSRQLVSIILGYIVLGCLQYMTFEEERGIILDELPMILYNSKLEEVSYIMNRS